MKKYIVFILFLLLPFMVHAQDVKITDVTLVDSSIEAEQHPDFEKLKISFDLSFTEIEDFAKYKVTIKNDSKKDYEIENTTKFSDKEYIKYEFSYDGDKVVKAGATKELFITITYNKEVPSTAYKDGKYKDNNSMVIILSDGETASDTKNPYTATLPYIVIVLSIIALILFIVAYTKKKKLASLLLVLLLLPIAIYALEKITIEIEANIEIEKKTFFVLRNYCSSENNLFTEDLYYEFEEGMTFDDYFNSDYYNKLDSIHKIEIDGATKDNYTRLLFYNSDFIACEAAIVWPEWKDDFTENEKSEFYIKNSIANQQSEECYSLYYFSYDYDITTDPIKNSNEGEYKSRYKCLD